MNAQINKSNRFILEPEWNNKPNGLIEKLKGIILKWRDKYYKPKYINPKINIINLRYINPNINTINPRD